MTRIEFHSFYMGDVEDPELYVSHLLHEFMRSKKGQWIADNCHDAQYITDPDPVTWGFKVTVFGTVEAKLATEYYLRWG